MSKYGMAIVINLGKNQKKPKVQRPKERGEKNGRKKHILVKKMFISFINTKSWKQKTMTSDKMLILPHPVEGSNSSSALPRTSARRMVSSITCPASNYRILFTSYDRPPECPATTPGAALYFHAYVATIRYLTKKRTMKAQQAVYGGLQRSTALYVGTVEYYHVSTPALTLPPSPPHGRWFCNMEFWQLCPLYVA